MRLAPISINSFAIQNKNNRQNGIFSNVSFQSKLNKTNFYNLVSTGYKPYKNSVPLISKNKLLYGKTFLFDDGIDIIIKVTDDKYREIGLATAALNKTKAEATLTVKNYYKGKIKHVGKAAYDSLLEYIKENHQEINMAKANIINKDSYKFHIAYGFKNAYQNNPADYNRKSANIWLYYSIR
jgi:effector-binding domain-containing protein